MCERASSIDVTAFHRAIYLSCAGMNSVKWLKHFKSTTQLDWTLDIVGGSAQYLRQEGGSSTGRTLVLLDESQRAFDPVSSVSDDLWDLVKNITSASSPDRGVTIVFAAMYNIQLEDPAVLAGSLCSPVRFAPGAIVDLRYERPPAVKGARFTA